MGRRRPWILLAQSGMLASFGALIMLPDARISLVPVALTLFVYNLFGVLQDVATDALAVDLLEDHERGTVNGAMWSSRIVGIAIGSAGMGSVLEYWGWHPAIGIQMVLLLGGTVLLLLVREQSGDKQLAWSFLLPPANRSVSPEHQMRSILWSLWSVFRQPATMNLALLALLASVPTRMMIVYGPIFAVQDLGWSGTGYAQFAGGPALIAGAMGAVLGGWWADRVGRGKTIGGAIIGIVALFISFSVAMPWWSIPALVILFLMTGSFLDMALRISLQAVYMTVTSRRLVASQFSIFMALSNMSNVLGGLLIALLSASFDAPTIFTCAATVGLLPLLLVRRLPTPSMLHNVRM